MKLEYKVKNNVIEYLEYPFKCSYAFMHKIISASSIQEMVQTFGRPALCINNNEFIFLSKDDNDALLLFCERNDIPVIIRVDVWGYILECFLDTELTEKSKQYSYKQLNNCGISEQECYSIRKEVSQRMIAYNFTSCLWEWCYLGLFDLLCASTGIFSGDAHRLRDKDFERFYFRTMDIAFKGITMDTQSSIASMSET